MTSGLLAEKTCRAVSSAWSCAPSDPVEGWGGGHEFAAGVV